MIWLICVLLLGASAETLEAAYPVPSGFVRKSDSAFGQWLRTRSVADPNVPILTYDGRVVGHKGRVIALEMVSGDRQQCADSIIRLRAEWELESGHLPSFHATSGDPMPWKRFVQGEKPYEKDGRIAWKQGSSKRWEDYLSRVFIWAGTASLAAYDTEAALNPTAGDVMVQGGFPGHAILLLDVVERGDERLVLVGEGYMPAQNFHVEHGPVDGWWRWKDGVSLNHWRLKADTLRRFPTR